MSLRFSIVAVILTSCSASIDPDFERIFHESSNDISHFSLDFDEWPIPKPDPPSFPLPVPPVIPTHVLNLIKDPVVIEVFELLKNPDISRIMSNSRLFEVLNNADIIDVFKNPDLFSFLETLNNSNYTNFESIFKHPLIPKIEDSQDLVDVLNTLANSDIPGILTTIQDFKIGEILDVIDKLQLSTILGIFKNPTVSKILNNSKLLNVMISLGELNIISIIQSQMMEDLIDVFKTHLGACLPIQKTAYSLN